MNLNQNPFGLYDFLGYLVPGFIAVACFILSVISTQEILTCFNTLIQIKFENIELIILLASIIIFYVIGHIIAILSHIIIERYHTTLYNYPSKYLFQKIKKFGIIQKPWNKFNLYGIINGTILRCVVFPVYLLDIICNLLFAIHPKTLPSDLSRPILKKLNIILKEEKIIKKSQNLDDGGYLKSDSFRFIYHYSLERTANHITTIKNYVALFGFTRALSFIFLITWWGNFFLNIENIFNYIFSGLSSSLIILSYIFYLGFVKFYRRYTLEAIMGAVAINDVEKIKIS